MSKSQDTTLFSKILLSTIAVSVQLYTVSAYDIVPEYEILFDLPLLFTVPVIIALFILLIIIFAKTRKTPPKSIAFTILIIAIMYLTLFSERNGLFMGQELLHGEFLDDRSRLEITLNENGNYILFSDWMLGIERYEGQYLLKGDTILIDSGLEHFRGIPGKAMLWDRPENKLYFDQRTDLSFSKSFYYFTID